MTRAIMPVAVILEFRLDVLANFHAFRTTRMEFATLGRMSGTRNIAVEYYSVTLVVRIGHGHSGQQCQSIRMHGIVENVLLVAQFDKIPEIHDSDSVRNMLYHA